MSPVEKAKVVERLEAANSGHCDANDERRSKWRPLFSAPAFGFTNEQHALRGKKVFCVISESLSDFFFFCRVNPNLKDLKPTFALKTESLFVFFG